MAKPKKVIHWYLKDANGKRAKRFTTKKSMSEYCAQHPDASLEEHVVGWQIRVWNNRIQKSETKNFKRKADADTWGTTAKDQVKKGAYVNTKAIDSTTFRQLMEMYISEMNEMLIIKTIKITTFTAKKNRINQLNSFFGDYFLSELSDDLILDYANERINDVKPGSIKKELDIISHALNLAPTAFKLKGLKNSVQQAKPAMKSKGIVGKDEERSRRLMENEEQRILEAPTKSIYGRAAFGFSAETAIRLRELCNASYFQTIYSVINKEGKILLKTESFMDVHDLINKHNRQENAKHERDSDYNPDIIRSVKRINKKHRYYQPDKRMLNLSADQTKTGKARDIYLSDKAIAFIESVPISICGRLFQGTPYSLPQWLERILRRIGFSDITDLLWHDLRHEGTTRYFEKGFHIEEVQLSTGHSTLSLCNDTLKRKPPMW